MKRETRMTKAEEAPKPELSRRDFIKVCSVAGGALVLGVYLPSLAERSTAQCDLCAQRLPPHRQ